MKFVWILSVSLIKLFWVKTLSIWLQHRIDIKQYYYPYDKAPLSSLSKYYGQNKNCTYMTVFIPDSCCIACSIHPTRTAFLIDEEAKILYTPLWVNEPESRQKRKGSPQWSSKLLLKVPQVMNIMFLQTISIHNYKRRTLPKPVKNCHFTPNF